MTIDDTQSNEKKIPLARFPPPSPKTEKIPLSSKTKRIAGKRTKADSHPPPPQKKTSNTQRIPQPPPQLVPKTATPDIPPLKQAAPASQIQKGPVGKRRPTVRLNSRRPASKETVSEVGSPPVAKQAVPAKILHQHKEGPIPVEGRPWSNSQGMEFSAIEPGLFMMGSPRCEADRWSNEIEHPVRITRGFCLGKYPVTQGEWKQVMHSDLKRQRQKSIVAKLRDRSKTGNRVPMTYINWKDCRAFCKRLTDLEHSAGSLARKWQYDLPTEAQWEYACRSDSDMPFSVGNGFNLTRKDANFGRLQSSPTEVGAYSPNAWGLHDMQGNAWEWCLDWHARYPKQEQIDPMGPAKGDDRVIRGGCFFSKGQRSCRSANRGQAESWSRNWRIGFRVAIVPNPAY